MTPIVPPAVAAEIGRRVGDAADAMGWDRLPQADKTAQLAAWVEDEDVGGILKPLVGGEAEVRLWLKDVALKRRSRRRQLGADVAARRVFGEQAEISILEAGLKPSHATVEVDGAVHYLAWGPHANVRNLFWAAVNAAFENSALRKAHVVIVDSADSTTPLDRKARFEALAARCGVELTWLSG